MQCRGSVTHVAGLLRYPGTRAIPTGPCHGLLLTLRPPTYCAQTDHWSAGAQQHPVSFVRWIWTRSV